MNGELSYFIHLPYLPHKLADNSELPPPPPPPPPPTQELDLIIIPISPMALRSMHTSNFTSQVVIEAKGYMLTVLRAYGLSQ